MKLKLSGAYQSERTQAFSEGEEEKKADRVRFHRARKTFYHKVGFFRKPIKAAFVIISSFQRSEPETTSKEIIPSKGKNPLPIPLL
jgi:hypothetical protein